MPGLSGSSSRAPRRAASRRDDSDKVDGVRFEIGEGDELEGPPMGSLQQHLRRFARLQGLSPTSSAETPAITGFQTGKAVSELGVERSLPRERENSRNSAVMIAQTVCEPTSRDSVSQQPLRNQPVLGARLHGASGSPNTFT